MINKDSTVAVKLREKCASGELKGMRQPKKVWMFDSTFEQHKLENFRTFYNKIKKEYSGNIKKVSSFINF